MTLRKILDWDLTPVIRLLKVVVIGYGACWILAILFALGVGVFMLVNAKRIREAMRK